VCVRDHARAHIAAADDAGDEDAIKRRRRSTHSKLAALSDSNSAHADANASASAASAAVNAAALPPLMPPEYYQYELAGVTVHQVRRDVRCDHARC
jgi:hypothetical protein